MEQAFDRRVTERPSYSPLAGIAVGRRSGHDRRAGVDRRALTRDTGERRGQPRRVQADRRALPPQRRSEVTSD